MDGIDKENALVTHDWSTVEKNIHGKVSDVPYWVVVDTIPENTKTKNVEKLQHPVLEYWCVRYL